VPWYRRTAGTKQKKKYDYTVAPRNLVETTSSIFDPDFSIYMSIWDVFRSSVWFGSLLFSVILLFSMSNKFRNCKMCFPVYSTEDNNYKAWWTNLNRIEMKNHEFSVIRKERAGLNSILEQIINGIRNPYYILWRIKK